MPGDPQVNVRYAQGNNEEEEKALVPTMYYKEPPAHEMNPGYYAYEEPRAQDYWNAGARNVTMNNEGRVSLDVPTLMFIPLQDNME